MCRLYSQELEGVVEILPKYELFILCEATLHLDLHTRIRVPSVEYYVLLFLSESQVLQLRFHVSALIFRGPVYGRFHGELGETAVLTLEGPP